ncbi:MAG: hypothetical protein U1B83_04400, partial [Candidatus Cloacimonadaceae bacterium]|nr:hypothetical protein [Candidatus Cloacimonadaceae bacterium]
MRAIQGYKVYRDDVEIAQVIGTDYLDSALANGIYQYYIVAIYSTGISQPSNMVTALVEVLYPPSNLSFTVVQDDVNLTWQPAPVSGRSMLYYQIYRNGSALAQTTNTSYMDMNLANGIYQYHVSAIYDSGESQPTNTISATVEVTYPVTMLSASVIEDSVTLAWTLPAISVPRAFLGYFIYRNGALYQVLDDPTLNSWIDNGLANGAYSYYMVAVYDAGLSIPSNVVNVTINVQPDLFAPTGLTAILSGERDVNLSWTSPAVNVQFYRVFRNAVEIATTAATSYNDLNLANGSYDYYVKAQYAEGLSSASETATVNIMIADPPTALSAQIINGNSVLLNWTAPNQGEIGFLIYRNGIEINYVANPQIHQFTDPSLANGSYQYRVAAVYSNVISSLSNPAMVNIVVPYAAQNFSLQVIGDDVALDWSAPMDTGGLTAYRVYRNGAFLIQITPSEYLDQNLANGSYDYYVTAMYGALESPATPTQTASIQIAYAPQNLSAISSVDNVYLSWSHVSDMGAFVAYHIWRNGQMIAQTGSNSYNDNALANGSYEYYVTAQYAFGTSAPSNTASVIVEVLYPPTGLVFNVLDNDVNLSWTAPATSAGLRALLNYKVYRNNVMIAQVNNTAYTDLDLNNGSYTYYVKASYDGGDSAPTQSVNVLIEVLYPPSNLVYQVNGSTVALSWIAVPVSGATLIGYKVYRDGVLITTTSNTTYSDAGLTNGSYSYQVSAQYSSGESLSTNTVLALVEVLYPPQNLAYTQAMNDVSLSWSAHASAANSITGYQVFRNGALIATVTTPAYNDNDLNNGDYAYYVKAVYNTGLSVSSNQVDLSVLIAYVPTGLSATLQGQNNVALSWTAPNQTETGFVVYRDNQLIATITNPQTVTYLDQNLPNGLHSYRVGATYIGTNSNLTDPVTINILVAFSPQNLSAQANGTTIQLNWNPPQDINLLNGYRIYRSINGTPQTVINVTQNSYSLTDAVNGLYSFHVTALYGTMPPYVESAASNTATATVFIAYAPLSLTASVTGDDVSLSWTPPNDLWGWQSYSVFRDGVLLGTTSTTAYNDLNLANGTYSYWVTAQYALGSSAPSNSAMATVLIAYAPPTAQVLVETNDVLIQWTAPNQGETGYAVYRDGSMIISIADPLTLSHTDLDLANDDYQYEVKAVYGSTLSASTDAGIAHVEIIHVPSNLIAQVDGRDVHLSWTPVSDPGFFVTYRIYRDSALIHQTTSTQYVDADLINGVFIYKVSAQYQAGESAQTAGATAQILNAYPPQNLLLALTGNDVTLTWEAPVDAFGLDHYVVNRNGAQIANVTEPGYDDSDLPNGNYSYSITAVYSDQVATTTEQALTIIIAYPPQ